MFLSEFLQNSLLTQDFNNFWAVFSNLKVLSMALFSDYLYPILIASYVLLLAMVAVISLTLHKNFISKKQNIYSQILANYKNTVVNYS
jgi:NADH:ubiquinone oxidoreductase subunit 6 (subunit J)